ncbi:MAG TPA: hypothetical protein PLB62_13260, partial [Candidatus Sumerlaeota bacterium]|nr:hypothetical protein [Candidatus Sumerlaeota bacterium]
MRAMTKNPHDRIASVDEFIRDLKHYLSGAGKRRESEEMTREVKERFSADQTSYRTLSECIMALSRAQGLWPENPEAGPMLQIIHEAFARQALKNKDYNLAYVSAERVEDDSISRALIEDIHAAKLRNEQTSRYLRIATVVILIFLVLLIGGGIKYTRDQKEARFLEEASRKEAEKQRSLAEGSLLIARKAGDEAAHQRDMAENARRKAERNQYYSSIMFVDSYLNEGRMDKARQVLINQTPEWMRRWEWGYLLSRTSRDDMLLYVSVPRKECLDARFSPDGTCIVSGTRDGYLFTWDAATGRRTYSSKVHENGVWTSAFSPDGSKILTLSFDKTGKILDAKTGKTLTTLIGHNAVCRGGAFSHDGKKVVSTGRDSHVRIWNVENGALINSFPMPNSTYDAVFSPDDSQIAVAMISRLVYLIDAGNGTVLKQFEGHGQNVLSIRFDSTGNRIITACSDSYTRIYETATGVMLTAVEDDLSMVHCAAFSPDDSLFATSGEKGQCRIYDTESGKLIHTFYGGQRMYKVAFSPKGDKIITSSEYEIRIWPVNDRNKSPEVIKESDIPINATADKIRLVSFLFDRQ